MIANYDTLFNGESRFGTSDGRKPIVDLGGLIVDDAHVAFSDLRDAFTYTAKADTENDLFRELASIFRENFNAIGKLGTFEDIMSHNTATVLEVPYWAWKSKENRVRDLISSQKAKDNSGKLIDAELFFKWPFLRDQLSASHALVSQRGFTITPILPLVDEVPSYSECPRRVFMSATVNDDSTLIKTSKLEPDYLTAAAPGRDRHRRTLYCGACIYSEL